MAEHYSSFFHLHLLLLLLLFIIFSLVSTSTHQPSCPSLCVCDEVESTIACGGLHFTSIPDRIPDFFETLVVRNSSIRSLSKFSFRRTGHLKEIRFEHCNSLHNIEKLAFKSLKNLRKLSFLYCTHLTQLNKGAFSGIANEHGVKISFIGTPIQRIQGGAFRHAHNIRELTIEGDNMVLSKHCFATINQLDFLTLSGVALIEPQIFTNSTRFYVVNIHGSSFDIPPKAFENLGHVHQLIIQRNRIGSISTDAFAALNTIEIVEVFDNQIGTIHARAFTDAENIGRLKLSRNHIEKLESVESILSQAVDIRIEENNVECECDLQWMTAHTLERLADTNYCSSTGVFRSVRSFLRHDCVNRPADSEHTLTSSLHHPDSTSLVAQNLPFLASLSILCVVIIRLI